MAKSPDDCLFETYLQEYGKRRDEMENRTGLQNGMAQRGIYLTALTLTLLATLFTFFMKEHPKDLTSAEAQKSINLFWSVCIPVLLAHGFLILLTIATWIYQLSMMFRILRYWNWIVREKLEPMIHKSGEAFLWDRVEDPPWDLGLDRFPITYFQPLFLYALSLFSFAGYLIARFWEPPGEIGLYGSMKDTGLIGFPILAGLFVAIGIIHVLLVKKTEASKDVTIQQSNAADG